MGRPKRSTSSAAAGEVGVLLKQENARLNYSKTENHASGESKSPFGSDCHIPTKNRYKKIGDGDFIDATTGEVKNGKLSTTEKYDCDMFVKVFGSFWDELIRGSLPPLAGYIGREMMAQRAHLSDGLIRFSHRDCDLPERSFRDQLAKLESRQFVRRSGKRGYIWINPNIWFSGSRGAFFDHENGKDFAAFSLNPANSCRLFKHWRGFRGGSFLYLVV